MDGSAVPEESLINNVHLSRCFFFVSDVLRQIMESGSAGTKEKTKIPLGIPFEKRERFAYSETPISASEIAMTLRRSTSAVQGKLKKLLRAEAKNS